MRTSTSALMLSVCGMITSLAQKEIEACSRQVEGENCSYSTTGGLVRHGVCEKIGPQNHSMLACLRLLNLSDPACRSGLLHAASRACCASYCSSCSVLPALSLDPACSVEHILRLSPPCSQSRPPCVLVHHFVGQIVEKNSSDKHAQREETNPEAASPGPEASEASEASKASKASVMSDLLLPLLGGFAVSGCSLTLFCSMLYYCAIQRTPKPSPSPTSPTTKSCIGKKPKHLEPKRKGRAKAKPKQKLQLPMSDLPDPWNVDVFRSSYSQVFPVFRLLEAKSTL